MASLSAAHLFGVENMVFVITGGGTGIGKMMAHALDQNGAAKVYILGRRMDKLEGVAKEAKNGSIVPLQADVTSTEELQKAAALIRSEEGFVNVVIANSGIIGPGTQGLPKDRTPTIAELQEHILKSSQADFAQTFAVNNAAMFYTLVVFLDLLDAGNTSDKSPTKTTGVKSQFIATSSIAALHRQTLAGFAYASSKAGVNHLLKGMATMLAPHHIRCNVICPGFYPSEMNYFVTDAATKEGTIDAKLVPATRAGGPEDMAGVILSLCGRGGAYYNGMVVVTDGGRTSILPGTY